MLNILSVLRMPNVALVATLCFASSALANPLPHYVKTLSFGKEGQVLQNNADFERAAAWILRRTPHYWVRLEVIPCNGDRKTKDDTNQQLIDSSLERGRAIRVALVDRTVKAELVQIVSMGQPSAPAEDCKVRLTAGPSQEKSQISGESKPTNSAPEKKEAAQPKG